MIKKDFVEKMSMRKRRTIALGIISVIITPYTALITGLAFLIKQRKGRRAAVLFSAIIAALCAIWISISNHGLLYYLKFFGEYERYYFLVDPFRLMVASAYSVWFLYHGHTLNEGAKEWTEQEQRKEQERMLPIGKFNYLNRDHLLLFGATGAGKGITLNHIIKYNLDNGYFLIFISAKLASTDKFSQLSYIRKLAKLYNRKLCVVSMNPKMEDACLYNPLAFLDENEIDNAIGEMVKFNEDFYEDNFAMWIKTLVRVLRAAGEEVDFFNILRLYEYDEYYKQLQMWRDDGSINKTQFKEFSSKKIKGYATSSEKDVAKLDRIFSAGSSVFRMDAADDRDCITITEVIKENGILYFDLDGKSRKKATTLIGSCIMADLQHVTNEFVDGLPKTIICDEVSFYISDLFLPCFNEARSAGYQFICSTQGPVDYSKKNGYLLDELIDNSGQFGILRVGSDTGAEKLGRTVGTKVSTENTRRVDGNMPHGEGSMKAIDVMPVNPNVIKNLDQKEMVYYEKRNDGTHEPHPVIVRWRTDDL